MCFSPGAVHSGLPLSLGCKHQTGEAELKRAREKAVREKAVRGVVVPQRNKERTPLRVALVCYLSGEPARRSHQCGDLQLLSRRDDGTAIAVIGLIRISRPLRAVMWLREAR